jgi:hypothetical protein
MDRVEIGFIVTAITSALVLVSSIVWLAVGRIVVRPRIERRPPAWPVYVHVAW